MRVTAHYGGVGGEHQLEKSATRKGNKEVLKILALRDETELLIIRLETYRHKQKLTTCFRFTVQRICNIDMEHLLQWGTKDEIHSVGGTFYS